jgi:recombination protein RecA
MAKTDEGPQRITLRQALNQVEKQYGKGVCIRASDDPVFRVHRIPTGIFALDFSLAGGFPAGRISLVYGKKSSAKTTCVLKAIAQYQRMCGRCFKYLDQDRADSSVKVGCSCVCPDGPLRGQIAVWCDAEGTFDRHWATQCGVDMDGVYIIRPEHAEMGIDVFTGLVRAEEVGFAVMDSVAALVPSKEIESSAMDWQQGLGARLTNKLTRQLPADLNAAIRARRTLTIILINQVRMKITGYGPVADTAPHGLGQIFSSSVILKMNRPMVKIEKPEKGEEKEYQNRPERVVCKFRVEASKVSPPYMEGEFDLMLRDKEHLRTADVDDLKVVLAVGKQFGYVYKGNNGWVAGGIVTRTQEELANILREDRVLLDVTKYGIIDTIYNAGQV